MLFRSIFIRDNLSDKLLKFRPDVILHMAARCGGILANKNSPADFLRDNTQMALNIYEVAREANVKLVYSLGSVCAYPKYCPPPFKEDDIWNGPAEETNFPYGQAKRTLMMLGQTYRQQYRSEEHTSELQSLRHLVCRLLLEKKKRTWADRPPRRPTHTRPGLSDGCLWH